MKRVQFFLILFIACAVQVVIGQESSPITGDESWNDYYTHNFAPFKQGNWHTNLTINYGNTKENNQIKLLANVIEKRNLSYGFGFSGGYFFKNYISVGLNIKMNRSNQQVDYLQDADIIQNQNLSQNFVLTPFIRNYIPLTKNNRFSVFNETGISIGYGQTLSRQTKSVDEISKYYDESMIVRFGIKPGINAFIVERFSFEVSVDLIGFEMEYLNSEYGEEQVGSTTNVSFDFKVDLLSLNFGVAYYF